MEKILIGQENQGHRIDKFLAKEFFLYSRGELVKKIKNGEVKINGKIVKASYVLETDDQIAVDFPRDPENNKLKSNDKIELEILFENEDIVVVNKAAGVQVHPSHNEKENTLVNALISKYSEIVDVHDESDGANMRPGIVHRLDKDTSGVMVVARNMESFFQLKNLFKNREVEKIYLAVAKGIFTEKEGEIDKPIARSTSYKKQVIARHNTKTIIRNALTKYKVIEEFGDYSLVEVMPKTGRMHQIRIHLSSIGHPIVGDKIYGTNDEVGDAARQLLHAKQLSFELSRNRFSFEAPMPEDFMFFLQNPK